MERFRASLGIATSCESEGPSRVATLRSSRLDRGDGSAVRRRRESQAPGGAGVSLTGDYTRVLVRLGADVAAPLDPGVRRGHR